MKHQDRVKEFNKKFTKFIGEYRVLKDGLALSKPYEDWLLTQFNEITREARKEALELSDSTWKKKIKDIRHTVHTSCCCNDMLDKLLK